ncbi:hypothetical protein HDU77_000430, partial [Chytriomyces hyalinus]
FLFAQGVELTASGTATRLKKPNMLHVTHQPYALIENDIDFISYTCNVTKRHIGIQKCSILAKSNSNHFADFNSIVRQKNFKQQIQDAIDDPSAPESKVLEEKISQVVLVSQRAVPYSTAARRSILSKAKAYTQFFEPQTDFITFSFSFMDSMLMLNMCNQRTTPVMLDQMQEEFKINIPSLDARRKIVADHPGTAAKVCTKMLDAISVQLLGIQWSHMERKTIPVQLRPKGVATTTRAAIAVHESGGNNEHIHMLYWGSLLPSILSRARTSQKIEAAIGKILDSIVITTLPEDVHAMLSDETLRLSIPRLALMPIPSSLDTSATYTLVPEMDELLPAHSPQLARLYATIASRNIHQINPHNLTCSKGKAGMHRCRMGMPAGIKDAPTGISPILVQKEGKRIYCSLDEDAPSQIEPQAQNPSNPFQRPIDDYWVIEQHKPSKDSTVVPCNIGLALATATNGNHQHAQNAESAIYQQYYTANYSAKDGGQLQKILPLLLTSIEHTEKYPSKAEDAGTVSRQSLYELQRLINDVSKSEELTMISASRCSSGYAGEFFTHLPLYVDIHARSKYLDRAEHYAESEDDEESGDEDNDQEDDQQDDEDDAVDSDGMEEDEAALNGLYENDEDLTVPSYGGRKNHKAYLMGEQRFADVCNSETAQIFSQGGFFTAIAMYKLYEFRGPELQNFGFCPWQCIIAVVPKKETEQKTKKFAKRCEWAPKCPVEGKYVQEVRTVLKVPQYIGKVPCLPKNFDFSLSHHKPKANRVGKFLLDAFCPTSSDYERDWNGALEFMESLHNGCYVDKQLLELMGRCIENLSIDKVKSAVYREYRFRNAKEWTSHQRLDYQNQHAALNKMIDNTATMNNDVSQMLDDAYMTSFVLKPA